jgi:hypothetical protein
VSKRLQGRVKKLEGTKKSKVVHFVYIRPDETREEALEIYKKKRTINPGDLVYVWGNMPIPDWYKERFH